ncbi:hypothetical protein E8E12_001470 [Didymella heteroderae]|uniref:Xylanolytic transcriptional activator regulatory domain-containing protein n=1 Tax=Didymella heteroderae TaxID=1769908 RepID=A0A9P5BW26_9PLEO|nr:hypothetical protein E8E12_001470 [Didymella heteroderae]
MTARSSGHSDKDNPNNAGNAPTAENVSPQVTLPTTDARQLPLPTALARVQPQHATPSGDTDTSNDSRHRDASWSTVFEGLLQRRDHGQASLDKCSISYVGEAFPLGIVSRSGNGRPLLHHAGPAAEPGASYVATHNDHPVGVPPEDISYLEAKQAFKAPPDETLDVLITIFMERVFPLYPVISPREFLLHHKSRTLPWILLHSVCFAAATFCPLRVLHRAGYDDRKQARSHFYGKTKALFDVGYESSKIVTLQVSILLSFWGGSPNNHWNFYTWLSTGVTVAETIGCHRSMAGLNIAPQDRSLLKRLWWTLVIRDAACASMHGRPFRINLEHCDVDELTLEDFEQDVSILAGHFAADGGRLFGLYQIQAAKLALILRQIVTIRFYPRSQESTSMSILPELLLHWRNSLPASLQWSDSDISHTDIFRTTLRILYNHNVILSHIKPEPAADDADPLSPSSWLGDEFASLSAQQIASLACAMVTASEELVPPHELFHGLFMACVVFFVQSRSNTPITASLGRSALTNCKMALHVHRETWDASSWVTQLFDKALARPVASTNSHISGTTVNQAANFSNLDILDTSGLYLDGMEGWPNHLFLGDLFNPSANAVPFATSIPQFGQDIPAQY